MNANIDQVPRTYAVCRTLTAFDSLSDDDLEEAVYASIDVYLPELQAFDNSLPHHLHRDTKATWLEFTCATIHICNQLAGFCLSPLQASAMMAHVDLLYRVDDFMESLGDTYDALDTSAILTVLQRCLEPFLEASSRKPCPTSDRCDSPVSGLPSTKTLIQFEQDLQDVVDHMHSFPICDADRRDRQWYSLELYDFLVAQLEQLDSKPAQIVTTGRIYRWVTDVGARSVGTNHMFAMFSCLVSAVEGHSLWKSTSSLYLAQEFAQQISIEFRILNDIGGRTRDGRNGSMSSCALIPDDDYTELLNIADMAASTSETILEKMATASVDDQRTRALLDIFRRSVKVSGELYMANEPNRVAL